MMVGRSTHLIFKTFGKMIRLDSIHGKRSVLTRYRIRTLLAVKPLERVYSGHGLSEPDHEVLVRHLLPGTPAQERQETAEIFKRHMMSLAELTALTTLPVLEFTHDEDGPLYWVTDMPRGTTLAEFSRAAGSVPPSVAASIGVAVGQSLAHAHVGGLYHGALHGQNVLIDSVFNTYVMDLGLGQVLCERFGGRFRKIDVAWESVFCESGAVAPEVLDGGQIVQQTDVYGLGILLYRLSTGVLPFTGTALLVQNAIVKSKILVDPRNEISDLDPGFASLIVSCLARNPADRPQSMEAVLESLSQWSQPLEQALDSYVPLLDQRAFSQRFEPMLRVVDDSDSLVLPPEEPAASVVTQLFTHSQGAADEAQVLASMSEEEKQAYLEMQINSYRRSVGSETGVRGQVRRGVMYGGVLAVIGLILLWPLMMDDSKKKTTSRTNQIEVHQSAGQQTGPTDRRERIQEAQRMPRKGLVLYLDR
jgi:serine/threonine protein kinase